MHQHGPQDDPRAPSDWSGARAIEVMLADVEFPATAEELRARAGLWRVPMPPPAGSVPLADLLATIPPGKSFRSARDVARSIKTN